MFRLKNIPYAPFARLQGLGTKGEWLGLVYWVFDQILVF